MKKYPILSDNCNSDQEFLIPPLRNFDMKAIDKMIGSKFMEQRKRRIMSQHQLGLLIDRTFQQIQKYEKGINRIPQGIFLYLAYAWNQDVSSFFPNPVELFGEPLSIHSSNQEFEIDFRAAQTLESLPSGVKSAIKQVIYSAAKDYAKNV